MPSKPTDVRPVAARLYFLPVRTRVPLKFGPETLTEVICARVRLTVETTDGRRVEGWGETPLSVQWVWPSKLPYDTRCRALQDFCIRLAEAWARFDHTGHAMEIGCDFLASRLPELLDEFNADQPEPMPYLAALVCCSPMDIALHDAYGMACGCDVYKTYNARFMSADLAAWLVPADDSGGAVSFAGLYPADFLLADPPVRLKAWHLVGGKDLLSQAELTDDEPDDGYPVLLRDWIRRDGLMCLKIKLRGNDAVWDYERLVAVGQIAIEEGVRHLSTDFNCTVTDCDYVNDILDRIQTAHPAIWGMILYVEQPFPYDLEASRLDVRSVAARKPLFMDESAHDWRLVKLGRQLGWTGVALKTCKTQTGALLSLCWAKAHGMALMVQDLTNPMLAQIPHCRLGAHADTIMGVETNAMQFYPDASAPEAAVHPGLYRRRNGTVDLSTVNGPGFGYRIAEIARNLPPLAAEFDSNDQEER